MTSDDSPLDAALRQPETPLHRALGSSGPFELEPTSLRKLPSAPVGRRVKLVMKSIPEPRPAADPLTRKALDRAQAALRQLGGAHQHEARLRAAHGSRHLAWPQRAPERPCAAARTGGVSTFAR